MAEPKSNYQETKEEVLASVTGEQLKILELTTLLIDASNADVEDMVNFTLQENTALKLQVLEAMIHHAWKIVMGYAGFAVAMGQKIGTIDEGGLPTATMPEGMGAALTNLNEELAQFKDAYDSFVDSPGGE